MLAAVLRMSEYGVPQGSFWVIYFAHYVAPIATFIASFDVNHMQYADDIHRTQQL